MRIRTAFDLLSTILVATAAGVLLWRTAPQQAGVEGERSPRVERIDGSNLHTTITDATIKGDGTSPIVMIEYSDFQCPFCARFVHDTFDEIDQHFVSKGLVQYVFRNYPIEKIHPAAMDAAKAAECASHDGRFWEMRQQLFANQAELAKTSWLEFASRVGISQERFERCLVAVETQEKIIRHKSHANSLGVSSTPTFLIGVRRRDGSIHIVSRIPGAYPYEVFERALNEVLASSKQAVLSSRTD